VHWDDGSACADPCDEGAPCPEEYTCESGLCAPDLAVTGEPCRENGDCVRHVCGEFARGRFCTEICDAENPCPSGFECVATQDAVDVCARPAVLKERGDGCRAAPGGRFDLPALVVLGFALVRRRRP
jgi:hypothetical protein